MYSHEQAQQTEVLERIESVFLLLKVTFSSCLNFANEQLNKKSGVKIK